MPGPFPAAGPMALTLLARPEDLPRHGEHRHWAGLPGSGAALAIAEIANSGVPRIAVLAATVTQAEALEAQLRFFLDEPSDVTLFPDLEVLPYDSFSPHQDLVSARLKLLRDVRLN